MKLLAVSQKAYQTTNNCHTGSNNFPLLLIVNLSKLQKYQDIFHMQYSRTFSLYLYNRDRFRQVGVSEKFSTFRNCETYAWATVIQFDNRHDRGIRGKTRSYIIRKSSQLQRIVINICYFEITISIELPNLIWNIKNRNSPRGALIEDRRFRFLNPSSTIYNLLVQNGKLYSTIYRSYVCIYFTLRYPMFHVYYNYSLWQSRYMQDKE